MFPNRLLSLALFAGLWLLTAPAFASDVVVELRDGRTIAGTGVAPNLTNEQSLGIEASEAGIIMSRRVAWAQIRGISATDKQLAGITLPAHVARRFITATSGLTVVSSPMRMTPLPPAPVYMPQPTVGVVVGVREDPLNAYVGPLSEVYGGPVPQLEAGFARELARSQVSGRTGVFYPAFGPFIEPTGPVVYPNVLPNAPQLYQRAFR